MCGGSRSENIRPVGYQMVTEEKTVDLVLCDEHLTLPQEAGLSIKVSFLVWQVVEDNADAVGVIR